MDKCDRCQQRLVVKDGRPAPGGVPGCFYVNRRAPITDIPIVLEPLPTPAPSGRAKRNASTTANEQRKRLDALHTLEEFQSWMAKGVNGAKFIDGPEVARQALSPKKALEYIRESAIRGVLGEAKCDRIRAAANLLNT